MWKNIIKPSKKIVVMVISSNLFILTVPDNQSVSAIKIDSPNLNTSTEDTVKLEQQGESRGEVEEHPGEPPARKHQKAQAGSSLDCLMN